MKRVSLPFTIVNAGSCVEFAVMKDSRYKIFFYNSSDDTNQSSSLPEIQYVVQTISSRSKTMGNGRISPLLLSSLMTQKYLLKRTVQVKCLCLDSANLRLDICLRDKEKYSQKKKTGYL